MRLWFWVLGSGCWVRHPVLGFSVLGSTTTSP